VVLFDEKGEMPLNMLVKRLRVLQEKKFIRVGGTQENLRTVLFDQTYFSNLE